MYEELVALTGIEPDGRQFSSVQIRCALELLVTLEPDETGMQVVDCPSIPGCISQGRTEAEALDNIREAIAGCLETRGAHGMPLTIEVREVEVPG